MRKIDKKQLDNLNKRDLVSYRRLANRIIAGFNNDFLDVYAPVLLRFIANNYVSDETKVFELDDFIQECLIRINGLDKDHIDNLYIAGLVEATIYKVYKEMCSDVSLKATEPVYLGGSAEELEVDCVELETLSMYSRGIPEEDELYRSFVLKDLSNHPNKELVNIVNRFWNGRLDKDTDNYGSSMDSLFEYFMYLQDKCKNNPNLNKYLTYIDQDISLLFNPGTKADDTTKKGIK